MSEFPLRADLLRHLYAQLPPDAGLAQWNGAPAYRWVMSQEWLNTLYENFADVWTPGIPVYLLGFPVTVEPDSGVPHLETVAP